MHITMIGTGYVGLVTGACFAEMGNHVTCVDIDTAKIDRLKDGILPIYEPGLETIVHSCAEQGLLQFSNDLATTMQKSRLVFIAVGTPPGEDGSADIGYVLKAAEEISQQITEYIIVVNKSTVPVGTADKVHATIEKGLRQRGATNAFDVVSNPEFLKEGAAVEDFMRPDRIVVGTESDQAKSVMEELYAPFSRTREKIQFMGVRDAEMTKYAANAMLATKISFMNEIANLCEKLDVDVQNVRHGIGSDNRIGYSFIFPGCGYGGSCFPKDVKALINMAHQADYQPWLLDAVEKRNHLQKQRLFEKLNDHFQGDLSDKTIAVWGLSFKPGTDDMREASSMVLIEALINAGAKVKAYDPVAKETARQEMAQEWLANGTVEIAKHQYEVIPDADALVLVTEWKFFRQPDFECIKHELNHPVIFDGRNQYDPKKLRDMGFTYYGIGR